MKIIKKVFVCICFAQPLYKVLSYRVLLEWVNDAFCRKFVTYRQIKCDGILWMGNIATASWFCLAELDPVAYIEVATESRRQSCTMQ